MGYESMLVVVEAPMRGDDVNPWQLHDGAAYCRFLAAFELGKMGDEPAFSSLINESINAEKKRIGTEGWRHSFFEIDNGDKEVTTDKYGDPVSPVDMARLIDVFRYQEETCPRGRLALAALELLRAEEVHWTRGVVVLHYGH